ncbi:MAG: lipopolysaccharide heptosyltransferase I [Acidobacteria bacterium]|nr:lipopolysaccharide heptosyltransferase I [Acidobacteriota bacterium]
MRILLVRLSSFGDVLFTLPTARALKEAHPGAELGWAIEAPLAGLVQGSRWVDAVFPATTRAWRKSPFSRGTWKEIRTLRESLDAFAPDLVVDAQGLFKSALVTWLAPSGRKVGFGYRAATEAVNALVTDEHVTPPRDAVHSVDRALALAGHVAGPGPWSRVPDVSHAVDAPDETVDAFLEGLAGAPFALLQPFSSLAAKEWPPGNLLAAARLLEENGLRPVLRFGPGERERAEALVARGGGSLLLAPPAGAAATARLAARATLFVGADTGPTHLAAAAGTPTVALFGPTDPARFGPVGRRVAVLRAPPPYNPGSAPLAALTADEIFEAARPLLE